MSGAVRREEERIQKRLEELSDRLQLSAAQMEGMTDVLLEESMARQELFGDGGMRGGRGGFDGMREKMTAISEARDEGLAEVLQPWQVEEYKKAEQEQRRGFMGGRGGGDRGGRSGGGRGGRGGGDRGGE